MSEMIERVARAICIAERMNPDDKLGGWVHWQEAARAAIEATREPTKGHGRRRRQRYPRQPARCFGVR